jgi:hypothetical protein
MTMPGVTCLLGKAKPVRLVPAVVTRNSIVDRLSIFEERNPFMITNPEAIGTRLIKT